MRNTNEWNLFPLKGVVAKAGQWWVCASQWSDKMCVLFDVERELVRLISNSCCSERWRCCSLDVSWIDENADSISAQTFMQLHVSALKSVLNVSCVSFITFLASLCKPQLFINSSYSLCLSCIPKRIFSFGIMNELLWTAESGFLRRNRNETGLYFETHIWSMMKTENSLISAIIRQLRLKSRFTKKEMLISGWTQSCQATTHPIESRRWLEACNTLFIPSSTLARSIPRLCWRFIKMTNTRTGQTKRLK